MSLLLENYIFYVDLYLLQNFCLKAIVLYLSLSVNKQLQKDFKGKEIIRILVIALVGTVLEMICLFWMDSYGLYLFFSHVIELPVSVLFLSKGRKKIVRISITGYFFTIIVNGVLEILWNIGGEKGSYFFCLMVTSGIVLVFVQMWKKERKEQKGVYLIKLFWKDKEVETNALYDSGNHLKDPYTKSGVHIVSEQVFQRLGLEEEGHVWIPYKSLGNEQGLMKVYYIDKMQIFRQEECMEQQKIAIGRATDGLFSNKTYEIILNEEVF